MHRAARLRAAEMACLAWSVARCARTRQTTAEETLFHEWESSCLGCAIARQYDPAVASCPVVDCSNTTAAEVAHAVLADACTPNGACCQTTATQEAFHVMMAYHDICDHDDVPNYVEVAVGCAGDREPASASAHLQPACALFAAPQACLLTGGWRWCPCDGRCMTTSTHARITFAMRSVRPSTPMHAQQATAMTTDTTTEVAACLGSGLASSALRSRRTRGSHRKSTAPMPIRRCVRATTPVRTVV